MVSKKGLRGVHCLFRNVHSSDPNLFVYLYKTYVIPVVEYCSPIWSPTLKKDIQKIESVQKTFSRLLYYRLYPNPNYPHSLPSYQTRLKKLKLKSLFCRRIITDLLLAFRILKGELRLRPTTYWRFRPTNGRHSFLSFYYPTCRKTHIRLAENEFFFRTSKWLSKLPGQLLECDNSQKFRKMLLKTDILRILGIEDIS